MSLVRWKSWLRILADEPLLLPLGDALVERNCEVFPRFTNFDAYTSDGIAVSRGGEWSDMEAVAKEIEVRKNF